jgi:hypothetical protein
MRGVTGSGWLEVSAAIAAAPYPVQALPPDPQRADVCLATLGVTTRSWLGAVIANTGGLLIDYRWLRVLGSGGDGLPDVLVEAGRHGLVVGYDVLGGQFAWLPAEPGKQPTIHYFGPDDLNWLDLEQGYADWLYAVLSGSLTGFYNYLRWPGWESEVLRLRLDQGIHTSPPPSSREGRDLSTVTRSPVPMAELVSLHHEMARQKTPRHP